MTSHKGRQTSRRTALGLFAGVGAWAAGCTRTVYRVRNPDGTWSEVGPDADQDIAALTTPDGLSVQVLPANPYIVEGERVHLMLVIEGPPVASMTRAHIDVALVMDRSGSMRGAKLEGAKDAVAHLLDGLGPSDRLSLISYASDVQLDLAHAAVTETTKQRARRAIEAVEAGGGTDIGGGLELGFDQLRTHQPRGALSRVVLLSDGRPTLGDTSPHRLSEFVSAQVNHGISLTTMGFGLDYNEALMTRLAAVGDGDYYYVEHARSLASSLGHEIRAFGATVGRDLECLIELPPQVQLEHVHGYRYQRQGRSLRIPMAHIAAGQRRRLLVTLRPQRNFTGTQPVARTTLTYREANTRKRRQVSLSPVHVNLTRDRRLVARSFNRRVIEKLETVRNAYARQSIMQHLDRGDFARAELTLRKRRNQARGLAGVPQSKALRKQLRDLEHIKRHIEQRPRPNSRDYKRLRKADSKETFDMLRY